MHGAVHVLSVFSLTNPRQLTAEYFSLSLGVHSLRLSVLTKFRAVLTVLRQNIVHDEGFGG